MSNPILEFIANNSTTLATGGAAGSLGFVATWAQKELVSRCSEWIGIKLSATKIKVEAEAEGEAAVTKALADVRVEKVKRLGELEITAEVERALAIRAAQTTREQRNVDAIVAGALPDVGDDATPQNIDEDWLNNFFDKSRLVSDAEMQALWSKVLAGEANSPGKHSKRLVNLLQSMEKEDAESFRTLCRFCVNSEGKVVPVVFDTYYIYEELGFSLISNLQSLGLIIYDKGTDSDGIFSGPKYSMDCDYFGYRIVVDATGYSETEVRIGTVALTPLGEQLAALCDLTPVDGFPEELARIWGYLRYEVTVTHPDAA